MKKLLFILILLIPFVIKAESDFELAKMWEVGLPQSNYASYYINGKYIKIEYGELNSIDALTGEKKTVNINTDTFRYAIYDNRILTITSSEEHLEITLYNENLTQLSKENIELFAIDHCRMYNNKYIIISGYTKENDDYTRYVYFIDSEGKVYKSDKKRTIHSTNKYKNGDKYYFMDIYGNTYNLEDYKIVNNNQNSDGSYIVNNGDKLVKLNANGNQIGEVTIPVGHNPSFIKKGNVYYIIANINTKPNNRFRYRAVLYKMDNNLNLSEPTEPFPEEQIQTDVFSENTLSRFYYRLFINNNRVYVQLLNDYGANKYYEVSENLEITPVTGVSMPTYSEVDDYKYEREIYVSNEMTINEHIPDESYRAYLNEIIPSDNEYNRIYKVIVDKDHNAYVNVLYLRGQNSSKLNFVKIDSEGKIVFTKTIYDWSPINGHNYCYGFVDNDLNFFDDYIVTATNTTSQNIIKIYDKDGNEVLDLSEDVNNYSYLAYVRTKVFPRGIYFEYTAKSGGCIGGVSAYTNDLTDTLVLGTEQPMYGTYMVYYEFPFLVSTKVNGGGNVTAKQIRALTGSSVEFTVTPDPGYVLSVVKVTDANGNVLTFTNNTFVMPSSDVIIEATFVPINPNTKAFISYIILGLCAITGLLTVFLSSKKKQYE